MNSPKPVKIKKIELTYENGTRLIVNEMKTPVIGRMFFDSVKANQEIEWEIIEPGSWLGNKIKKLGRWFSI